MPAKKRTVEMGTVEHRAANVSVQVYYDRTDMEFRATYAGARFVAPTEAEVKKAVYDAIVATLDVLWQSVIHIRPLSPSMSNSLGAEDFVGFQIERIWVARFPDGRYRWCQWNGHEQRRLLDWSQTFSWGDDRDGPFVPPTKRVWYQDTDYYLPYSDALWEKVQFLREKIKELRHQLLALFGSQEGLDQLLELPWLALPEPGTKEPS